MNRIIIVLILLMHMPAIGQPGFSKRHLSADSIVIHCDLANIKNGIVVDSVVIVGNKQTKAKIIFRELTFKIGDTIQTWDFGNRLGNSRQNLLNTSLFNFVTIADSIISDNHFTHVVLTVTLIEQWYVWPFPIVEISDRNFNAWWENKDFNRLNYGFYIVAENMRGRMETMKILVRAGYDERYELSYTIPYINQKQTIGAGLGVGWSQNHEIAYQTVNNKLQFVKDENQFLYKNYYSYLYLMHRHSFYDYHIIQGGYNFYSFGDTVLKLNPDYSFNNLGTNEYFSLTYRFISDHRDSKIYPLSGYFVEGSITKSGIGMLLNNHINMLEVAGSLRKYAGISKKFNISSDVSGKLSFNPHQPYFFQKGLGYDRMFVRGYELYVIDGQNYWLWKNTLKYTLIPTRVKNIGLIKSDKFSRIHYAAYFNWFIDAGYVGAYKNYEQDDLSNKLLLGTGLGLDFVTYYDIVFRIEFSVNRNGESGFFIHFRNTL